MSCPWAKIENTQPVNLEDIMCEQFAKTQQVRKEQKYDRSTVDKKFKKNGSPTTNTFVSDEKIAKMFQVQYDKEYNNKLKYAENKFNSVLSMSEFFDNCQQTNPASNGDAEEEILDIEVKKDWSVLGRELDHIPQYNYNMRKDSKVAMVPDIIMSKRKNNSELSVLSADSNLLNKIFHSFKKVPIHIERSNSKLLEELVVGIDQLSLDQLSCFLLYKMIESHLFQSINGIIHCKEAVIFHAEGFLQSGEATPKEFAVKVFKGPISELKYYLYLKGDNRFKNRVSKPRARKTTYLCTEKQMTNLVRLKDAGIRCPDVIMLKKNILVMSFIGKKCEPAKKLEDAKMTMEDYIKAYNEVVTGMKNLYKKANLIHTDLSGHNIFWYNNHCYFIDVSRSVEPCHKDAFFFLYQDCTNVCEFFSRKEVPDVLYPDELFKFITGINYVDRPS